MKIGDRVRYCRRGEPADGTIKWIDKDTSQAHIAWDDESPSSTVSMEFLITYAPTKIIVEWK